MPDDPASFPFYMVANKSDLAAERRVSAEKINEYCRKHPDLIYHETSALTGSNVEGLFKSVASNHFVRAAADPTPGTAGELSVNDTEDSMEQTA